MMIGFRRANDWVMRILRASSLMLFLVACADAKEAPKYQRTAFTLGLIGEAPKTWGYDLAPDFNNAMDVAYCAVITGDDVRASGKTPYMDRLRTLVTDDGDVIRLVAEAAEFEREAIDYARSSKQAADAAYYNAGGHKEACERAMYPERENLADCEEAFQKSDTRAGIQHKNTSEASLTYDGRYFAALVSGQARNIITVFDLVNKTRREVVLSTTKFELDAPSISADGAWIAVKASPALLNSYSDPNGILVIPVAGGDAHYISEEGANYGPPAISPAGDKIAYAKYDTGYRSAVVEGRAKRMFRKELESPGEGRLLYEYDLASGTERMLSQRAFQSVLDIKYLPDEKGLIFRFRTPVSNDGKPQDRKMLADGKSELMLDYYYTYFEFGSELPLWPEPVVEPRAGWPTNVGPDGTIYGFGEGHVVSGRVEWRRYNSDLILWRKNLDDTDVRVIDVFDKEDSDNMSVSQIKVLPDSVTVIGLKVRPLQCWKTGAKKRSEPFLAFSEREHSSAFRLEQLPAISADVVVPEF